MTIQPPNKLSNIAIVSAIIFIITNAQISRAEDNKLLLIEEVIVTANVLGRSLPEDVRYYPGNRNIITAQMLEQNAVQSIDGALQRIPGVKVQDETGTGVLPNVAIRGLNASRSGHTQFLLDGIPLTLAPYSHTGQSMFPITLKSLERIDIVRGGAAVQYGPNNVGGVINLVSKPIPKQWKTSLEAKLTQFSGSSTLTDSYLRTGGAVTNNLSLQLEGNNITGESFRDHSDTDVQNWTIKSLWNISNQQHLQSTLQYYDASTEMPGALHAQAYQQDRRQSLRPNDEFQGKTKRFTTRYDYQFATFAGADAGEFDWVIFAHDSSRNFQWGFSKHPSANHWADTSAPSTHIRRSPRDFLVWGTEPRITLQYDGDDINHKITLGSRLVEEDIDYKLEQIDNITAIKTTPRDWHLEATAIAAYISDEISLMDKRLTLSPGLRVEHVDTTFDDIGKNTSTDNKLTETLPGLTIGYASSDTWFFYSNAQRSLRVPQIAVIRGAGKEGAELAWNYEIGTRYTPSETSNINVSLYRVEFKDQLLYNSSNQSFENIGATLHQGFELEGDYSPIELDQLNVHIAYNYLDSEQLEGNNRGKQLPYASKNQLSWNVSYNIGSDKINETNITLSGFYFSSAYSDNANNWLDNKSGTAGELPSYTVWNMQLSKKFTLGSSFLFTAISVNNIFNKEYYFRGIDVSPSGQYPAPERSVSLDIKYTFKH